MENLWAPWRMEYIKSDKTAGECIFCQKPKQDNDLQNLILYRGSTAYVIMNYYPYNNGHLMVVPYRHLSDFTELTSVERVEVMELVGDSIQVLRKDMGPQGFNFGANLGKIAGAGIAEHLHFHVVPRWGGDTNFMPVVGHTKVVSEALFDTCRRLQQIFTELKTK